MGFIRSFSELFIPTTKHKSLNDFFRLSKGAVMRGRLLFARIILDSFVDHRLRLFDQCGNAPSSARNAYEKSKNDDTENWDWTPMTNLLKEVGGFYALIHILFAKKR